MSIVIIAWGGLFLILPRQTFAQSSSLQISPTLIKIDAKPPADVWTAFTLENSSNQPLSLKIGYKSIDPQSSSNGNVVFYQDGQNINGSDKKIFDKMQIVDDQNVSQDTIEIGPKQKLRYRLRIIIPKDEPSSDYYFSLLFISPMTSVQNDTTDSVEDQKSFSTFQEGIAANVFLSIGDKTAPLGYLEDFSAPWYMDKGPVPFNLIVHNSGIHYMSPYGTILIKNIFGQTIGKVSIPTTTILAGTSRKIQNPANSPLLWSEKFILGAYTATLTLPLSKNGPVYVKTVHFIAFPIMFFIEIIVILLVLVLVFLRVKKKMAIR